MIAFFLTQFHPVPENDAWWGKGFTEWTNTTKARPLFPGHYQPHLPADLGFYDLRLRAARHAQISLAKEYDIDGFCYHYYWFSGRRILEQPLNDMLSDPDSNMPFCICWANENWTRRWDAAEHEVLLAQEHRADDDIRFIMDVAPILKDPRYIHHDGAPLLIVYRPQRLPDARTSAAVWRDYCRSIGMPKIHLCAAMTHGNWDFAQFGFDSGVEFPPHNLAGALPIRAIDFYRPFHGHVLDYRDIAHLYLSQAYSPERPCFRTVFPSWDNTARREDSAVIVLNGTPRNYEFWLSEALRKTEAEFPGEARPVFINAWNEWAEGCHLEPDKKHGRQFLEATRRAKRGGSRLRECPHVGIGKLAKIPKQETSRWRRMMSLTGLPKLLQASGSGKRSKKEIKRRYRKFRERLVVLQERYDRLKLQDVALARRYQMMCSSYDHEKNQSRIGANLINVLRQEVAGYSSASTQPMPLLVEPMTALPHAWVAPKIVTLQKNGGTLKADASSRFAPAIASVEVPGHKGYLSECSTGTLRVSLPERFAARSGYHSAPQAFQLVEDAILFTWMGAVMPRPGHLIQETMQAAKAYDGDLRVIPGVSRQDGVLVFDPKAVGHVVSIDRPCLLTYHGSAGAYGHWWFDSIPSIWLWRDELSRGEILLLLPRDSPSWIHATLDLIGVPMESRVETREQILRIKECIVASSCSIANLVIPPPLMAEIGRQLVESIVGDPLSKGRRKLYLTRSAKASNWSRVLENEDEIVSELAKRGFEVVDPAAMAIVDQIKLFSQAGTIVAPHGSALTNVIFAPRGCGVIDLMPDVWTNVPSVGWIYDTTNIMEQRYACLLGETTWRSDAVVEVRSVPLRDLSMRYRVDANAVMAAVSALDGA